jgi:hypothetical protein
MQLRQVTDTVLATVAKGLSHLQWHSTGLGLPARAIVASFRAARAVNPQSAQRFHAGSTWEEAAFLRLTQLAVIREPEPGRYYLAEDSVGAINGARFFE